MDTAKHIGKMRLVSHQSRRVLLQYPFHRSRSVISSNSLGNEINTVALTKHSGVSRCSSDTSRRLVRSSNSAMDACDVSDDCLCHHHNHRHDYHRKEKAVRLYSNTSHNFIPDTKHQTPNQHPKEGTYDDEDCHILLEHLTQHSSAGAKDNNGEDSPIAVVSILTLNRPKAANAFGKVLLSQLQHVLTVLEQSTSGDTDKENRKATDTSSTLYPHLKPPPHPCRCLILTSSSPTVFSAGADLKERKHMTLDESELLVHSLRTTFDRLAQLPLPVIAAIEGVAVGGGLELALCADVRIAALQHEHGEDGNTTKPKLTLGLPETSLAIVPGAGGTIRLPHLVHNVGLAKELIFTAKRIDAQTACDKYGIIQHVVSPGQAMNKALDLAWQMARNGPIALAAAKKAIHESMLLGGALPQHQDGNSTATTARERWLDIERQAYRTVLYSDDRWEGLNAFAEKRKPEYRGK